MEGGGGWRVCDALWVFRGWVCIMHYGYSGLGVYVSAIPSLSDLPRVKDSRLSTNLKVVKRSSMVSVSLHLY